MGNELYTMNDRRRFMGNITTNNLWDGQRFGLNQYLIKGAHNTELNVKNKKLRLGHLVEQFIFDLLEKDKNIQIIGTNIQIIQDKKTVGELDCLISDRGKLIHLELVYKFYLYDQFIPGNEIEKWIGPNRKDSLKQKLVKLKTKQMPLLSHPKSNEIISDLGYNSEMFDQKVHFKAQLFIPLGLNERIITEVNKACIRGFYITPDELQLFEENDFFILSKLDWLIDPHHDVIWLSFTESKSIIELELNQSRSPLCWMKDSKGNITKLFVVFWHKDKNSI